MSLNLSRGYRPEDSVAEAIAEYLRIKGRRKSDSFFYVAMNQVSPSVGVFLFFLAELSADRIIAKLELVNTGADTLSDPTRKHLSVGGGWLGSHC